MKTARCLTRIMLLFIICVCSFSCIGPVPVDVVMIDNELFFVLKEEREINSLRVIAAIDRNKFGTGEYIQPLWALGHDPATELKSRKYPRLKQIKYGQKYDEFPVIEGPVHLQRNVEYLLTIKMGNKFTGEVFIITGDNKVIMPRRKVKEENTK
ncbi:MAG: hypothetical protein AB2L12_02315 [Smithellaceae bacterium]